MLSLGRETALSVAGRASSLGPVIASAATAAGSFIDEFVDERLAAVQRPGDTGLWVVAGGFSDGFSQFPPLPFFGSLVDFPFDLGV